jgi:hypothetical protein
MYGCSFSYDNYILFTGYLPNHLICAFFSAVRLRRRRSPRLVLVEPITNLKKCSSRRLSMQCNAMPSPVALIYYYQLAGLNLQHVVLVMIIKQTSARHTEAVGKGGLKGGQAGWWRGGQRGDGCWWGVCDLISICSDK